MVQAQAGTGKAAPFYAPFERLAVSAISLTRVPLLITWVRAYFCPEEAIGPAKASASFAGAAANLFLSGIVLAAVSMAITLGMAFFNSPEFILPEDMPLFILAMAAIYPSLLVLFGFIGSAVLFMASKILGGSGGYMQQTFVLSLVYCGWAVLAVPFTILAQLPLAGIVFSLAAFAIEIFMFYGFYRAIKSVHGISSARAALAVSVPLALLLLMVAMFAPAAAV